MIEKSRVEELIKEGATIFMIKQQPFIAGVSNFIGIQEETLSKENNIGKDNTLYWKDMGIAELEYLFETKEQAEWALKYQHIPRTEYLDLPMWEESNTFFEFKDKNGNDLDLIVVYGNILIQGYNADNVLTKEYFNKPATEENYIKACDLCVKLFKGEE